MSLSVKVLACVLFAVTAAGCYVETRPAPPCAGAVWVDGWRDRYGRWVPGHWQCGGRREVIIVR